MVHDRTRHNAERGKLWFNTDIPVKQRRKAKMEKKNFYDMEHGSVVDTSLAAQMVQQFCADNDMDVFCEKLMFSISKDKSYAEAVLKIKALVKDARAKAATLNRGYVFITGKDKSDHNVLICCYWRGAGGEYDDDDDEEVGAIDITVDIYAEFETAASLKKTIAGMFDGERLAMIKWWYIGENARTSSRNVYLQRPKTSLHPEYYPDLGDPYVFLQDYMESDAAVLLMAGPPGTGKTTMLRHLIAERKLTAHVIYDEKLMEQDSIFQSFLFDRHSDIMIIEDADTILSPRERDGNKMMSRFLSVSDGLIKLPNKKLVFTTNISDFTNVDPALLRPGRCHAQVHTRPLNLTEAQAAAKVANVPIPTQKGEYTLAELFNQGYRPKTRQIGFGSRN
jgi:hypothetical protein